MNDHSPRRYKGSLLERAAEQHAFGVPPVARTQPQPAPQLPRETYPDLPPLPPVQVAPPVQPVQVAASEPAYEEPAPAIRRGFAAEGAAVPAAPTGRRKVAIDPALLSQGGMLVPGGPITALAEEFRQVKRQLLLTARAVAGADAQRARMVLVCSAQPNEGKTFCAINLAVSMSAEKDVEILLVDADLAKPDVLDRLGVAEGPGLLDVLSGAVASVEDCIIDTDIPQLSLLPAGTKTHGDTELLASDRARRVIDGLTAANPRRIVIFDSPPALAASPAAVLALHAGQVMLVVRADRTTESDLREATAMLDGCEHIQLVLNSVSFQPGGRRFGSYYEEAGK
ncbi:AAA family ATPase [Sphingomonas sp. AOB5]|uniref:AAA family ATPase n=1 Tax=Sphingomonas sp. AOB5 TaxID=3034017 RepID=UPI0023F88C96|nr:AAA family ATPase [Sphingomonas sp. AOB5]MDF7776207.1 AAA family ATPase [Sphingomonas sp. AOB5]